MAHPGQGHVDAHAQEQCGRGAPRRDDRQGTRQARSGASAQDGLESTQVARTPLEVREAQALVNVRATLCPPKPNELLIAAICPSGSARGVSRTRSSTSSGSGSETLIVGGALRSCRASTVKIDSRAPAPPSRWPVMDFVAESATPSAASPSVARTERASTRSPTTVDVACALTCTTSCAVRPASPREARIAAICPRPSGSGDVMWYPSDERP